MKKVVEGCCAENQLPPLVRINRSALVLIRFRNALVWFNALVISGALKCTLVILAVVLIVAAVRISKSMAPV
jgi:hypothetical protein